LHAAVNTAIALVTAPASTPGSVDARVASEAAARTSGDAANAGSINTVNARLNSGGDVAQSIVQVQTSASAAQSSANAAQSTANAAQSTANTAASQITTVQSRLEGNVAPYETTQQWDFQSSNEGWGFPGITATNGVESVTLQSTGNDPMMVSPNIAVNGARYDKVRMRVRRNAGSGWQGTLYYSTAGHGESESFKKTITDTPVIGQWVILEWDMAALTAGGTDWATSTITRIRIDLGTSAADSFTVDWVSIGRRASGATYAAVQQEISTRASETGYLGAQYTLRLDVGGRVVGFGISSTSAPGAQPTADFGIVADRFYVAAPMGTSGVGNIVPFAVQATPVTTAAGEVLPAGVYINAAFIRNLEAALGRFQNAIITNAMIVSLSATKITAGSLAFGEYIQSTGFTPGGAGIRMSGNGDFEARSVGGTRVININASGSAPVLKVGSMLEILANGTATFAGALSAATGTFAGALQAATGTFNGVLAGSIDVKSAASGARMEIKNNFVKVFDENGVLRIQLGDLSA
jgi:hypothetical protein